MKIRPGSLKSQLKSKWNLYKKSFEMKTHLFTQYNERHNVSKETKHGYDRKHHCFQPEFQI